MKTIADAIIALNLENNNSHEFVIKNSEPLNEAEYQQNVKFISDIDDSNVAIFSNTQPYTWTQVNTKKFELQTAYNNEQYKRDRASEYPSMADQLDDIFHNGIDGWKATIQAIKDKYPKE